MINEVQNVRFKRLTQTISYLPHFLSWVVIAAIFYDVLSPSTGVIGKLLKSITGQHVMLMANPKWFRSILVFSVGWKDSGYSAIVYLAAMMAIDPQLYEAADIDGAGKFRKIWHITIPGIIPTIFFIIMLRLGAMLGDDTQQVLMFYNPSVYSVGDVLGTYVYRVGLGQMKYSYATALGLFTSLVGFMLLTSTNYVIDRLGYRALF
jgi:putative aldouronate transport system permease protein